MKKNFSKVAIALLVILAIVGCNDQTNVKNVSQTSSAKKTHQTCEMCNDPYEIMSQYPELFPNNILIFEDFDEAIELLGAFQDASYDIKGQMLNSELNINNNILKSHYTYDSITSEISSSFPTDEESEASLLTALQEANAVHYYQTTIPPHEYIYLDENEQESVEYEYEEEIAYVAEPWGNLDIYALLNEDGMVFIERMLFKLLEDGNLIMCSPEDYISISSFNTLEALRYGSNCTILDDNTNIAYLSEDILNQPLCVVINEIPSTIALTTNTTASAPRRAPQDDPSYDSQSRYKEYTTYARRPHGYYKMQVQLKYNLFYHWLFNGHTILTSSLTIKNYKKGWTTYWLTSFPTTGSLTTDYLFVVGPDIFNDYPEYSISPRTYHEVNGDFSSKTFNVKLNLQHSFFNYQIQRREFYIYQASISNQRNTLQISYDQQINQ